ncbi:MAG: HEPN domain-containing protein [Candidatus Aenigmarchaeota archaeon]|nr:HEPN domain-containing protein [Candidatus Aenigmarchaeota archaeon]
MKTRNVDRSFAGNYLIKARQCKNAAIRALETGDWDAAVINSIHASISAADAICVFKKGIRNAGETHTDSIALLISIEPQNEDIKKAARHLSSLLSVKTSAEYGERLAVQKDAEAAVKHAERLLSFAEETISRT